LVAKLFILEAVAHKAHKELDLAYNTTRKIYTKLRQCIYKFVLKDDQLYRKKIEIDERYSGGKRKGSRGGAKNKSLCFWYK
jgi:transposase